MSTETLVKATKKQKITRKFMAKCYAHDLKWHFNTTRWPEVNRAIIERWSMSGLKYIKNMAFRIYDPFKASAV